MRIFHLNADQFTELEALPDTLPATGYLWIGSARREFEVQTSLMQAALQRWTGGQLVDLHVSDLLNNQLPSHFEDTSWYDMLVFRRLAAGEGSAPMFLDDSKGTLSTARAAARPSCGASTPTRSGLPYSIASCSRYIQATALCARPTPPSCSMPHQPPPTPQARVCPAARPT